MVGDLSCISLPHHYISRIRVRMDDGNEKEFGPGGIGYVPPGHNAWVVWYEPFVAVDFTDMETYAKK